MKRCGKGTKIMAIQAKETVSISGEPFSGKIKDKYDRQRAEATEVMKLVAEICTDHRILSLINASNKQFFIEKKFTGERIQIKGLKIFEYHDSEWIHNTYKQHIYAYLKSDGTFGIFFVQEMSGRLPKDKFSWRQDEWNIDMSGNFYLTKSETKMGLSYVDLNFDERTPQFLAKHDFVKLVRNVLNNFLAGY